MTTPEGDPGVRVTLRDVWTEIRQLGALIDRVNDHEKRIRAAERWLYSLPISILTGIGSLVAALWGGHHG